MQIGQPEFMMRNCLYLVSSSANREYVVDCLEALALPRGMIQHFRYRFKYVDERLRASLPSETGELPRRLRDLPVVVVYLYQEQTAGVWKPGDTMGPGGPYLPLRCGRLIRAFKDGEIAHFYFELSNYVKPKYRRASTRILLNDMVRFRVTAAKKAARSYAHVSQDLGFAASRVSDTLTFQNIVDSAYLSGEWRTRSLGSAPLDVTYDIVFVRVAGLFRQQDDRLIQLAPVQRRLRGDVFAEYKLDAGTTYHIRLATHLSARVPAELPGQGRARLNLDFDPRLIRPVGPTNLRVSSLYNLEYWSFVAECTRNERSVLRVVCEHDIASDRRDFVRRELLCPEISLPISIAPPNPARRTGL